MKRFSAVSVLLLAAMLGCSQHYYRKQGDHLYLYLSHAGAKTVLFAYSKDGYKLHRAEKLKPRTWEVSLPAAGEFSYFYIVDGQIFLPPCPLSEKDDFGSRNCLFGSDM